MISSRDSISNRISIVSVDAALISDDAAAARAPEALPGDRLPGPARRQANPAHRSLHSPTRCFSEEMLSISAGS